MSDPTDALATALWGVELHPPDAHRIAGRIVANLPDGVHLFTVDSLAEQLHGWGIDADFVIRDDIDKPTTQQRRAAAHIIESAKVQAAKEAER